MMNYNNMKVVELRRIAQGRGIKGYQSQKKAWLVEKLEATETPKKNKTNKKAVYYEYDGKSLTIGQWSKELGIPQGTLRARITRLGWTIEEVITKSNKHDKLYEFEGKKMNLRQWAEELDTPLGTLYARINRLGWTPEEAFAGQKGA